MLPHVILMLNLVIIVINFLKQLFLILEREHKRDWSERLPEIWRGRLKGVVRRQENRKLKGLKKLTFEIFYFDFEFWTFFLSKVSGSKYQP